MIKNTCLSHLIILVDRFPYYLLWVILILKKNGSITHPGYVQELNWGPGPWSVPSLVDPWTWCTSVAWRIPTREPQLSQHGTPKSMVLFQKWSPIFMEKYVILKTMVLFHMMSILKWSLWIKEDDLSKMISNFGFAGPNHPKKKRPKSVDSVCHTSMFAMVPFREKPQKRASLRMNHGIPPISKYMFNPPISNARSTWKRISIRSSEETKMADMVSNLPKYLTYTPISDKMFIGETMIYKNKPW